jgi:hypothetical protein
MTLLRELDRIADEVHQDLAQAQRVANECGRNGGVDLDEKLQRLLVCTHGQRSQRLVDNVGEREGNRLEAQASRLNLREVEDVVENLEQRSG